jgi:hypothetical protein
MFVCLHFLVAYRFAVFLLTCVVLVIILAALARLSCPYSSFGFECRSLIVGSTQNASHGMSSTGWSDKRDTADGR